jgi:hypothetical protein
MAAIPPFNYRDCAAHAKSARQFNTPLGDVFRIADTSFASAIDAQMQSNEEAA